MQRTLRDLRKQHPHSIAVVYRHFPISRLGFALPAAVASECAAEGRFEPFADSLFASQDTLSRLDLALLAHKAGVPDTSAFQLCREGPAARARVMHDISVGRSLGVSGTPTLVVGDQLVVGNVTLKSLSELVLRASKAHSVKSSS